MEEKTLVPYSEETKIAGMEDYDVYLASEYINNTLPIPAIFFPDAVEPLGFYQTRESLADIDRYKAFIDNCTHRFRKSRTYKAYKSYLMSMGLDRCQINGNIQDGMADIEMHHNFLTIYDITILISQHLLNTVGRCTTFDVISLLAQEHRENNVPIVMLSETAHQLYHDTEFYIPISMTFGKWWNLLIKYRYGITLDIAYKVVNYIKKCQRYNELTSLDFYRFSDDINNWGYMNASYFNNYSGILFDSNTNFVGSSPSYEVNTFAQSGSDSYRDQNGIGQVYTEAQIFGQGF